ncbi:hypothetical protein NE237_000494 [Protea cynaroides]|uniref:Calcium homeostasis endoplasmic reticulum protein n=1 Tax=Protea cynaroides TaxID=273540 RepID=A0A9Q0QX88_9MAGN|nr:hypothetical protein NE237_000494 [Protea cynaroides]
MDRQAHDYAAAAAMAFAQQQQQQAANIQQQQQFGFHPQHQPFPQQMHGLPFLPPHPSLQQFPFHRHLQQQQQQFHPHPLHPSHPLHLRQQQQPPPAFPPHLPPHHVPSPYLGPFDSTPPPVAPPSDPELHKRIDKLVEYAAKNGPEFESMIREKQQDNPAYSFLFGAEGHDYYRYKLWFSTRPSGSPFNPSFPPSSVSMIPPPNAMMNPSALNLSPLNAPAAGAVASASMLGTPPLHQPPFPPFYDLQQQQHSQHFMGQARPDYDPSAKSFKGLSGPLPSDVGAELNNVLNNLTGTKESIKGAKMWFMQRSPFAPALAEALKDRVLALDDSERQLHIIYLANDILFDSLQRRINPTELDNEALAFKPVLGTMLARVYHNPHNNEANQSRLQKILLFWASKEVYDRETIYGLESEMMNGPPISSFAGPPKESSASADPSSNIGLSHQAPSQNLSQWQPDKQKGSDLAQADKQASIIATLSSMPSSQFAAPANQQYLSSTVPAGIYPAVTTTPFVGSVPISTPVQPGNQLPAPNLLPTSTVNVGEKLPPYPLFPPGLIPGMVKKMQIGSGVPYSPMSPLDIPTVIPPSTVPPSEILERVSRFFKEIGEVNPSEGPMKPSDSNDDDDDDDEYEREHLVRKGGACIPPPPNLQVDPETGTFADGSVERKPGSSSSGRLGLGAMANPNEVSQYDDVYTSYRKQRSTSYHSSMSARSAAR